MKFVTSMNMASRECLGERDGEKGWDDSEGDSG